MVPVPTMLFFSALAFAVACSQPAPAPEAAGGTSTAHPVVVDNAPMDGGEQAVKQDRSTVPFEENGPRYTWTIAPAPNGTFGFAIYDRGKLYIDQQKATGLGGPDGWKTKMDARTVAMAAMEKLEKGEVPEGLNVVGQ